MNITAILAVAALNVGVALSAGGAQRDLRHPTLAAAVEDAHSNLVARFVGPEGLLRDYEGEIPTPADCRDCRPNAMGWWSPIENGPMFTGPYLEVVCVRARRTGSAADRALARKLAGGLMRAASISEVKGMIVRGFGTDGACHYPLGSEDQTIPWFYGLHAYWRSGIPSAEEKKAVAEKVREVAEALADNDWKCPCDGAFAGQSRGRFMDSGLVFRGAAHSLFLLRAVWEMTGDDAWLKRYESALGKRQKATSLTMLEVCREGWVTDLAKFPMADGGGMWIYVCAQGCLARLAEMDPANATYFRAGLERNAGRARKAMAGAAEFSNKIERPFKYANWRTGYRWRPQKTQKDADEVQRTGDPSILGTRKQYERRTMTLPLSAAAVCAFAGVARDEVERTLRSYDYSQIDLCEFFLAEVAAYALVGAGAPTLGYDGLSLKIDGRREFLVSGEFHYFRVPKDDWRRRLRLLKDVGGNCVATYIPWCIHEPEEGRILFGDRPERDLDAFLRTVREEGLMAIVRPGPYQYSELVYDGLPRWLIEGHPEIATKKKDGRPLRTGSVDYNHPVFLEKARRYFKAAADVIRPHLAVNGGPVALVQLDNELTGIHVWFGVPATKAYLEDCADYLLTLRRWLAEDGIPGPYCHNAGGAGMAAYYEPCVRKLGTADFLMGYDHYYSLSQSSESPSSSYFFRALYACDIMRSYGYPPVGFEIQGGTIGDFAPILKEDLLACHMANLAAGLRGINYYVFTGGPNFPGSGNTVDIYDYNAPVHADGTLNATYESLGKFGAFVKGHRELLDSTRAASVQLGLEWPNAADCAPTDKKFLDQGMLYSLLQTPFHPQYVLLDRGFDPNRPLVLAGVMSMSAPMQRKVADFVAAGGGLLVAPDFPRIDHDGKPCAVLAEAVGAPSTAADDVDTFRHPVCVADGVRMFGLKPKRRFGALPPGARATLLSEDGKAVYGCSWKCGAGRVSQLGAVWTAQFFLQAEMVGRLVEELGAKPIASSSNRNVFVTAYRLGDGRIGVFALNLHSSPQETVVTLPSGASHAFRLGAMEVSYAIL